MSDLNDILAKHFAGEASTSEEAQIQDWKKDNPEEYAMLEKAWNITPTVETHQYNTAKAWKNVEQQISTENQDKIIRLRKFKFIAAAACGLLLVSLGLKFIIGGFGPDLVEIKNETAQVKEIRLPDGSELSLAPNSSIQHEKDFENNRHLHLNGQAFFNVERDESHPFTISTEYGEVEVLGTAFNVRCKENSTVVSVDHGSVAVKNKGKEVTLKENQSVVTTSNGLLDISENDINYLSWKTGKFSFTETPLTRVVDQLNQFYSKKIILETEHANEIELTATFDNLSFEEVVDIIETTSGLTAVQEESQVIFK